MSGGSYDYLCHKEPGEFFSYNVRENLHSMIERLAALGYAKDAALESQHLLAELRASEIRIEVALDRLRPIWKAIEWWDSADTSEDEVREALREYRGAQR